MSVLTKLAEITGTAAPYNEEAENKKAAEEAKKAAEEQEDIDDVDQLDDEPVFKVVKDKAKKAGEAVKSKASKKVEPSQDESTEAALKQEEQDQAEATENDDDKPVIEEIVEVEKTEEEEYMNRKMQTMNFYNEAGSKMYDFDRGLEMSQDLKSWIVNKFGEDQELAKEVLKTLPTIIERNPKLIPSIKEMLVASAEAHVPYVVLYLSKVDDKEYEDKAEAEAAVSGLAKRLSMKASDMLSLVYHKVNADGSIGAKVSRDEVIDFVSTFDGNKEALRKKLHLPDPTKKAAKKETKQADTADK